MAKELIGLTLYPKDKTLQTTLSEKVYAELKETCDACEIPIERFHGYKPIMLMLTLFRVKMHEFGVNTAGVDKYYLNKVKDTGKTVLALESNEEQLHLLANMGNDSDEDFVRYYLKYLNYFDEKFNEMIVAWRNGEPELILKQIDDYKLNFPPIYNSLLVDRNKKWIPQIEHYFETKETEFVIVGAMHLHGEDGVLQLMKNKGYKVEQL